MPRTVEHVDLGSCIAEDVREEARDARPVDGVRVAAERVREEPGLDEARGVGGRRRDSASASSRRSCPASARTMPQRGDGSVSEPGEIAAGNEARRPTWSASSGSARSAAR